MVCSSSTSTWRLQVVRFQLSSHLVRMQALPVLLNVIHYTAHLSFLLHTRAHKILRHGRVSRSMVLLTEMGWKSFDAPCVHFPPFYTAPLHSSLSHSCSTLRALTHRDDDTNVVREKSFDIACRTTTHTRFEFVFFLLSSTFVEK